MNNAERKLWLKLANGIEEKILLSKPIPPTQLVAYWRLRSIDPLIQMKWEAATRTSGNTIIFPNGKTRTFETVRVHE